MELKQLHCFVTVAETLHFGKAAQQMGMLPASLGRQIKLLEESLGTRLLVRSTRHVSLTDAGREFLSGAQDVVTRARNLEHQLREGHPQDSRLLRIGAIDSAAAGLLPQVLPVLKDAHPDIDIDLLEQKTIRLLPRLLSGRLDVALVRPPESIDPRLEIQTLFHETAVVAVPQGHPLSGQDSLRVEDMGDEPLIVPERRSRPHSHDLTMKLFLDAGLTARIAQIADEKQTIVSLVSSGLGLAIVPRWASRLAVSGVCFIPLVPENDQDRNRLTLSVAWLRDARHEARDRFMETLDRMRESLAATA